jgi:AcrR family transcriptional regulator
VRTHGWAGELPRDEEQARSRILSATRQFMASGEPPGITDVARAIGISRQTVYRYYGTTEDLLDAAALDAVVDLVDQLSEHVEEFALSPGTDHADVLVDVVLWVHGRLQDDPVLVRLVSPGRLDRAVRALTAPSSISLGRELLDRMPIDWHELGLDSAVRAELVEHLLRMLQTLVLDPGGRTPEQLRAYLSRWVAPAVRALR